MDELASEIGNLGRRARAQRGAADVELFDRLKQSTLAAELVGRVLLHLATGPIGWIVGTLALAYHLSVEAQLNHSVMHGAYRGLPGAEGLTPDRYETMAVPFQCRTWRDAHRIHHANPSVLGDDPDTLHPLFRVHRTQRWRPWHRFNAFLGALFTFEQWAFDYDRFLKRRGHRPGGDRRELGKFLLYLVYQLVLFPLLAGPHWKTVLVGGVVAMVIRNLIFTALQTGSSVGHEVSTRHHGKVVRRSRAEWLRFQIESSKNFVLGGIWRHLCGGLDRHIEHHLFPQLPPNRLPALSAEVRALCARHGIAYSELPSIWASLKDSVGYLAQLSQREPGPAPD